ncbi:hypothetical protein IGI80_000223 [Enterococcus sp. DIV1420a]
MNFPEDIYIYDLNETDFSHNGFPITDFWEEPEINRQINGRYALTGTYIKSGQLSDLILKNAVIRAKVPDGSWQLFRISTTEDDSYVITFTARFKALDVNRNFIDSLFVADGSVTSIMNKIEETLEFEQEYKFKSNMAQRHQFTIKRNHPIDAIIGSNNNAQNLVSVAGGELDMYDDTFYLKERIGRNNGFRIDFGINLEAIKETVLEEEPPNTLYLIGAIPEGDYDEKREPVTLKYLEAPGIIITSENRVIKTFTNENCKTQAELKQWADEELFGKQKVHIQKTAHEISLIDLANTLEYEDYLSYVELQLGDVIYGRLQNSNKEVVERVIEYTWFPRLKEYKKIGTGSSVEYYSKKAESKLNLLAKKVDHDTNFLKESIINATELITGNDSGHIMFWPKNRPRELRIMDSEDADSAKNIWRFNLAGFGHSSNGIEGPFETAITQDGKIVANFITAGILTGILVQGVALKTLDDKDFQVVIEGGKVSFERKRVSTGLNDVHGELFGDISATYDGSGKKANGFAVRQKPGYIFSINTISKNNDVQSVPIIQIPPDVHPDNRKVNSYASWSHEGNFRVSNEVDISGILTGTIAKFDKLYVGGQEVIAGQNGGGGSGAGTGGYPSEVISDVDKFAWDLWSYLLANGYSKAAAAGILGNVQGEVGSSMNPDTEQIGGPAYGWVQWDGSAYPLVGTPTWNGREYVQRLIAAAGIKQDYRTSLAQAQLINWCMFNGQWLGQVSPLTVNEYKVVSSPKTAAYAFELNFERPATAHPERQTYAQTWYEKFKDLTASTATGKAGIAHLEQLIGQPLGNQECYAVPAEYSGFLGGCGLGAGTIYGFSHVIGDTSSAADIGEAYDWNAIGWKVIQNPTYQELVVGAIANIKRNGRWGNWLADPNYGHTVVIYGLDNGRIQCIEQNAEQGKIVTKYDRLYFDGSIQSIVIPPK